MASSQPSNSSGQSNLGPPRTGSMVSPTPTHGPLTVIIDGSVLDAALAVKSMASTPPSGTGIRGCQGWGRARIYFGGTNADNEDSTYQIHLWHEARNRATDHANEGVAYWPEKVAAGAMTLGSKTYGATGTGVGASGNFIADTITDTVGRSGTIVSSPADNTQAYIDIFLENASFIQVETKIDNAATNDVLMLLGDAVPGQNLQIAGYNASLDAVDVNDVAPNAAQYLETIDFIDRLFDDDPNTALTYDADLRGYERFAIHFYTDVTVVGAAPQVIYSFEMSYDGGATFVNLDLLDTSDQGYDQLTAAITVDSEHHFKSVEETLGVLRITVTPANTDGDDTVQVNADLLAKKG